MRMVRFAHWRSCCAAVLARSASARHTLGNWWNCSATLDTSSPPPTTARRAWTRSAEDLTAALRLLTMCHAAALRVDQYKVVAGRGRHSRAHGSTRRRRDCRNCASGVTPGAPATPAAVVVMGGALRERPRTGSADTCRPWPCRHRRAGCRGTCAVQTHRSLRVMSSRCSARVIASRTGGRHNGATSPELLQWLSTLVGAAPPPARGAAAPHGPRERVVYDTTNKLSLNPVDAQRRRSARGRGASSTGEGGRQAIESLTSRRCWHWPRRRDWRGCRSTIA